MLSRSRVLLKRARQSARPMPKYSFLLLSFFWTSNLHPISLLFCIQNSLRNTEIRKYPTHYYVCHSVVFSRFKPPF